MFIVDSMHVHVMQYISNVGWGGGATKWTEKWPSYYWSAKQPSHYGEKWDIVCHMSDIE